MAAGPDTWSRKEWKKGQKGAKGQYGKGGKGKDDKNDKGKTRQKARAEKAAKQPLPMPKTKAANLWENWRRENGK